MDGAHDDRGQKPLHPHVHRFGSRFLIRVHVGHVCVPGCLVSIMDKFVGCVGFANCVVAFNVSPICGVNGFTGPMWKLTRCHHRWSFPVEVADASHQSLSVKVGYVQAYFGLSWQGIHDTPCTCASGCRLDMPWVWISAGRPPQFLFDNIAALRQ